MKRPLPALILMLACTLISCSKNQHKTESHMNDSILNQDLKTLQRSRIFFGHQSVGKNIIDGLQEIMSEAGKPQVSLFSFRDSAVPSGPFLAEGLIGKNGQPKTKCEAFRSIVSTLSDSLDIALMKFCYVDIDENTDIGELFDYYRSTVESLRRTCPKVILVHVTVPLTLREAAWRRAVKKILGRDIVNDVANLNRSAYNALLLRHFKGDHVFDLAALESTSPDGEMNAFDYAGKTGYCMREEYADDGAHLGPLGRRLAARALVHTLAAAQRDGLQPRGEGSSK